MLPTVLIATWNDGLIILTEKGRHQELAGQSVRSLISDGHGGAYAVVGGHAVCRRAANGKWDTVVNGGDFEELSCVAAVGDKFYIGTDDARVLQRGASSELEHLTGFDETEGRHKWYAGAVVVDGKTLGPPLGIRSMAATSDGKAVLANVHVGGIPRSIDGGRTWQPTIDIDSDVHQVSAHRTKPSVVAAAAATGLCVSFDGGATWEIEQAGLHAPYCSAVAFSGDDILVAASAGHFSQQGAVYRRPLNGGADLELVGHGLPEWLDGIADTGSIATSTSAMIIADAGGNLYMAVESGPWVRRADSLPPASSVLIL